MKIIFSGHLGSDAGWTEIDTLTGQITHHGGNAVTLDEIKSSLHAFKAASRIEDPHLRELAVAGANASFAKHSNSEWLSPNGHVIAIF